VFSFSYDIKYKKGTNRKTHYC